MKKYQFAIIGFFLIFAETGFCFAGQINIAVASNALAALKTIGNEFEKTSGHRVRISSGSTGKLYAQIIHGAPFDIFLAANDREPIKLEHSNRIVPKSRFTYALGKLVVCSTGKSSVNSSNISSILTSAAVVRIAIANPKIAPYGFAAQQTMQKLGVWERLTGKIIRGENVAQTYQFVMTNNAQIGFVAKSQILSLKSNEKSKYSYWEVPAATYSPIQQQAVWLLRAQHNKAAFEFVKFIKSNTVKKILTDQFGYGMEPNDTGA